MSSDGNIIDVAAHPLRTCRKHEFLHRAEALSLLPEQCSAGIVTELDIDLLSSLVRDNDLNIE